MQVTVQTKTGDQILCVGEEQTLLDAMKDAGIEINAPCNGRGTCGKCKIRVEGEQTWQLACKTYPKEGMVVALSSDSERMQVLTEFVRKEETRGLESETQKCESTLSLNQSKSDQNEQKLCGVVDLGTTTIVVQLLRYDARSKQSKVIQTIRGLNPQRSFGADVISRITAANEGELTALSNLVREFLLDAWNRICYQNHIQPQDIEQILIGGNTTMIYLLQSWDTKELGKYPFHICDEAKEFSNLPWVQSKKAEAFPAISAFVGGDILAGLFALGFAQNDQVCLLVDLGTNGEIALGNKEKILVTSTAAGPAFEGGNISCGVGSVSGAIQSVTIKKRYVSYQTIDNQPPIGICGTGAIEMVAELLDKGYIDAHGTLKEEYLKEGFPIEIRTGQPIRFTQEDIRQMQLAKGAIRAGIEVLLECYGITYDQVDTLYLAGGMGFALNLEKAAQIGLIPPELKDRVMIVGNSCLGGLVNFAERSNQEEARIEVLKIQERTQSIQLAEHALFTERYLNYMDF